jgi:hypothetical protein
MQKLWLHRCDEECSDSGCDEECRDWLRGCDEECRDSGCVAVMKNVELALLLPRCLACVCLGGWSAVRLAAFGGWAGASALGVDWCYEAGWDSIECWSNRFLLTPGKTDAAKSTDAKHSRCQPLTRYWLAGHGPMEIDAAVLCTD